MIIKLKLLPANELVLHIRQAYSKSNRIYSKLRITRKKQQTFAIFLQNKTTFKQFISILHHLYPDLNLQIKNYANRYYTHQQLLANYQQNQIQRKQQDETQNQIIVLSKQPIIQSIKNDQYDFYHITISEDDIITKHRHRLHLGIQILSDQSTNKYNVPKHIQYNISLFQKNWNQSLSALEMFQLNTFSNQRRKIIPQGIGDYKNIMKRLEDDKLKNIIFQIQKIDTLRVQQIINRGKAQAVMQLILTLKVLNSLNILLITYGKYGWSTGQPIGFLVSSTVNLVAILGVLNLNSEVQKLGKKQYEKLMQYDNIDSRKRLLTWKLNKIMLQL